MSQPNCLIIKFEECILVVTIRTYTITVTYIAAGIDRIEDTKILNITNI